MRTPPLLLGATLLFWGWQTGFLTAGVVMALALEAPRLVKARWDISDEDFSRLWTFCSVLFLAAAVYAFTANEGPTQFSRFLQNPSPPNQTGAGTASARTATALFRWLPMIFFLFVAAQAYSSREAIPLTTISRILRWRWQRGATPGPASASVPAVNVGFPYFAVCLFSAASHPDETSRYFWGLCVLLGWALWSLRSRRFGFTTWLGVFVLAAALGYAGQRGMGRLQNYLTNLNPQWFSRFARRGGDPSHSRTWLGQVGRLKQSGAIVIRLQPLIGGPPAYLREASYRSFRTPVWSVSDARNALESLTPETNGTTWHLLADKTNSVKAEIACYLDGVSRDTGQPMGLLPLPTGTTLLENLPVYPLIVNSGAAVIAEGPGLVIFDATYGPGATLDPPPDTNEDLRVPTGEKPALDQVIARLPLRNRSTGEALRAINGFFQANFTYSTWQRRPRTNRLNETPLSRFLLNTRSGHCEYFATATVLLLRELGIPARYAVGYAVHEASGTGYVVRQRDAHAWCLVWDEQARIWRNFDTTPASWVTEEAKQASVWQWLSDSWSWIQFQFSRFRWGQTHLRQYLMWLLVPILAFLLYQIIFGRKRRPSQRKAAGTGPPVAWPGLDSEFYLLTRRLAERGVTRQPNEPLSGWLERATRESALAEMRESLQTLLRLHYRCRFDPRGLSPEAREELRRGTHSVLQLLERRA
jgi:hypothetical protein